MGMPALRRTENCRVNRLNVEDEQVTLLGSVLEKNALKSGESYLLATL